MSFKQTKPRKFIMEILESSEKPLSADEIYLRAAEAGDKMNLSTVYRTLELLEQNHLAEKIILGDGKARYEFMSGHKHHLMCTACQKIISIDDCPIAALEKSVAQKAGFDITGHRLEIYGLCSDCKKKNTTS